MSSNQLLDLLGAEYTEWVTELAQERNQRPDQVVREALERGLAVPQKRREAALDVILSAETVHIGDPDELKAELDEARGRWE